MKDLDELVKQLKRIADQQEELLKRQCYPLYLVDTSGTKESSDCMHDNCSNCRGTGQSKFGGMCVHGMSCPCPKCSVVC